jgi:uncharacterized protein YecE (DUF72 family)
VSRKPSASASTHLFAGTSGWAYPTWKPGFYPAGTSAKKFLGFYSTQLNSVEVNYTFRALPSPAMLAGWLAQTPANFRFSFKAPQRITHFSRLRDCAQQVADLLACLAPVAEAGKLGLILFQLPPNFKADLERLRDFLAIPALNPPATPPIAFEFRHESWFSPESAAILTAHNAALCIAESDDLRTPELHTASTHTCFRLRRTGGYEAGQIAALAKHLAELSQTRDVYAYFKHEDEPTGALNASAFLKAADERSTSRAGQ